MAIKLIRKNNQDEVSAYEDATLFHQAKGRAEGGVFQNVYNSFGYIADNVNHKFILKSGMGMLYGRQFELPDNETYAVDAHSGPYPMTPRYYVVYVEIDTTVDPETIVIKNAYSTSDYPNITTGTDLYRNKTGVARLILYKFQQSMVGTITIVAPQFYVYIPGKSQAAESIGSDGKINGRIVSNLVYADKDWVKEAEYAVSASVAQSLGTYNNVKNTVSDALKFTQRNTHLIQGYTAVFDFGAGGITSGNTKNMTIAKPDGDPVAIYLNFDGTYLLSIDISYTATGQAHPDFINGRALYLIEPRAQSSSTPRGGFIHDDYSGTSAMIAEIKLTGSSLSVKALGTTLKGALTLTLMVVGG